MKRPPSAARSYLRRLAEPVPPRTALLTTHRSGSRAQSVREAIPPILDSRSDPVTASPARRKAASPAVLTPHTQTPRSQAFPVDASEHPTNRSAEIAINAHPLAEANSSTSVASDTPINAQPDRRPVVASLISDKVRTDPIKASRENLAVPEDLIPENNASSKSEEPRRNSTHTPTTATYDAAAVSSRTEPIPIVRDQGSRVHIGTVEVRAAAPVREPQPAPAIDRRALNGRSALAAEPLSRPLAWSHGLVQG